MKLMDPTCLEEGLILIFIRLKVQVIARLIINFESYNREIKFKGKFQVVGSYLIY